MPTVATSWFVALLFVYMIGLVSYEGGLEDSIECHYRTLSFTDEAMTNPFTPGIGQPNVFLVVARSEALRHGSLGAIQSWAFRRLFYLIWVLLPLFSIAFAGYVFAQEFIPAWINVLHYGLLFVVMFVYAFTYFRRSQSRPRR